MSSLLSSEELQKFHEYSTSKLFIIQMIFGAVIIFCSSLFISTLFSYPPVWGDIIEIRYQVLFCAILFILLPSIFFVCVQGKKLIKYKALLIEYAYYDALTQLPNRRYGQEKLQSAIEETKEGKLTALLFFDLDNFKHINDTLGHAIGDEVLRKVAHELRSHTKKRDIICRLGGDEFTIVMQNVNSAEDAAHACRRILDSLNEGVMIAGLKKSIGASAGISMFPTDGDQAHELLQSADIAMYKAKSLGKNQYSFFSEELRQAINTRVVLEDSLRHAMDADELYLVYQPKVDLCTKKVIGVEALLRWRVNDTLEIPPKEFIPCAEGSSLVVDLGSWVIKKACFQINEWKKLGFSIPVAINISPRHFYNDSCLFEETIKSLIDNGISPKDLEIEITESAILLNPTVTHKILDQLSSSGIMVALDDFGVGNSSLSTLSTFKVGSVKIDQGFIADIPGNPRACAVVSAIITMTKNLGLKVIAEGIETKEQLNFLMILGCTEGQGYYFSPPVRPELLQETIKRIEFR